MDEFLPSAPRRRGPVARVAVMGAALVLSMLAVAPAATAAPEKVLILDSTVTSGATSEEATKAAALGYTVDVVDDATWAAMSASDFGSYRAIILGDPTCGGPGTGQIAAAEANRATWGPQIDGNVVINGTDPVYHSGQGGKALTDAGIAFATDAPGKTGMYISLSCYYHDAPGGTPVTVLEPFGAFTTTGVGCYNDAHIVASHPALAGLTDEALSNWSCSVHEAFLTWPSSGAGAFTVLAIAEGAGNAYTAPDGSSGIPYVVARGEGLAAGDISLSPVSATNPVGTQHTVTALVTSGGSPLSGVVVTFTVLSGPHTGTTGTATTGADGQATFSYTGTTAGTDTIQASFTKDTVTQTSNTVTKEWTGAPPNNPPVVDAGGPYSGDAGTAIALDSTASDPDSDPLTYLWSIHAGSGCTFSSTTVADPTITCTTPGTHEVMLEVSDGKTTVSDTAEVTVAAVPTNNPPVVDAGGPYAGNTGSPIALNSTASDPDSDPLTYLWSIHAGSGCTFSSTTVADPTITCTTPGTHEVMLEVSDGKTTVSDTAEVTVAAPPTNRPPVCTAAAPSQRILWPPNHQFVTITIGGVTDPDGDSVAIRITSIRQDEPVNATGDGSTGPDGKGVGTSSAKLRAERAGNRDGRVYHIGFTASDGHGGTCSRTVKVGVPHDMGKGRVAIDSGATYNSTVG